MHWIDPQHLPSTHGKVERYLMNPHGLIDGLLLSGGLEVHVPPHLDEAVRKHAAIGDDVVVRGIRPRDAKMISAVSFGGKDGLAVLDEGPGEAHPEHPEKAAHGRVDAKILRHTHGPKGEIRGAILDDDTQLRWKKHHELERLHPEGSRVVAEGPLRKSKLGHVLDVQRIGADADDLVDLQDEPHGKKKKPGRKKEKR